MAHCGAEGKKSLTFPEKWLHFFVVNLLPVSGVSVSVAQNGTGKIRFCDK